MTNCRPSRSRTVILTSWVSRLIGVSATFYSLRVLSELLTKEEYSIYIILISFNAWFSLGDLGVGYSLQNTVSKKEAAGQTAYNEILASYLILSIVSCIFILCICINSGTISFNLFRHVANDLSRDRVSIIVRIAAIVFVLNSFSLLSTRIYYGRHQGYIANTLTTVGSLLGVLLLGSNISVTTDSLSNSVLCFYSPGVIIGILCSCTFVVQSLWARARIESCLLFKLIRESYPFFLFYLFASLALQVDFLIISQRIDSSYQIIEYFTLYKIFALGSIFSESILMAMWPKFTAQYHARCINQLIQGLLKSSLVCASLVLSYVLFVFFLRGPISSFLIPGQSISFSVSLILCFGFIAGLRCITDPCAIFLQSIGRLRALTFVAIFQAIVSVSLQWFLAGIFGTTGILIAVIISFVVTSSWALPLLTRIALRQSGQPPPLFSL
jgi:O-antigen/teichoic acid export membrane protein